MLTDAQKQEFEEKGFVVVRGLADEAQRQRIESEIEGIHERMAQGTPEGVNCTWEPREAEDDPPRIKQLMNSEKVSATLDEVLRSDAMLDIVEALLGPDISLFHSKLLLKSAKHGGPVPWHQDYGYWVSPENEPKMLNCQLAIDPATKENGCIQFVPGSHKQGLLEHEREKDKPGGFGVFLPNPFDEREDAVPVELEPGDAVFFGSLVIHGSAPNHSGRDRRMNTFAFNVPGNGPPNMQREVLRGRAPDAQTAS